jgi:hypothetical protein
MSIFCFPTRLNKIYSPTRNKPTNKKNKIYGQMVFKTLYFKLWQIPERWESDKDGITMFPACLFRKVCSLCCKEGRPGKLSRHWVEVLSWVTRKAEVARVCKVESWREKYIRENSKDCLMALLEYLAEY